MLFDLLMEFTLIDRNNLVVGSSFSNLKLAFFEYCYIIHYV